MSAVSIIPKEPIKLYPLHLLSISYPLPSPPPLPFYYQQRTTAIETNTKKRIQEKAMIIQGKERDTITITNYQFQNPIPIPIQIQIPIRSPSTSLSLSSPPIADQHEEESTSTFSTSYFHLLGSICGPHTPVGATNYFASKRALEQQLADGGDSDKSADPRKRRLMKNRESATRSRARKQALMNELQVEVTRLEEENLKLKQKCRELKFAIAAASVSSKKLRRTTSSEF